MEQSSVARRIQSAAWRSTGALPEETHRAWHDEDMKALGKGRRSPDPEGSGDLDDSVSLLTRPFSLAIIFLLAFAVILTTLLWRDGRFDKAIGNMMPKVIAPKADWMGSQKSKTPGYQPQANEDLPTKSEMDRVLEAANPQPTQAESAEEVETE
jgi:hypothetical protein